MSGRSLDFRVLDFACESLCVCVGRVSERERKDEFLSYVKSQVTSNKLDLIIHIVVSHLFIRPIIIFLSV